MARNAKVAVYLLGGGCLNVIHRVRRLFCKGHCDTAYLHQHPSYPNKYGKPGSRYPRCIPSFIGLTRDCKTCKVHMRGRRSVSTTFTRTGGRASTPAVVRFVVTASRLMLPVMGDKGPVDRVVLG